MHLDMKIGAHVVPIMKSVERLMRERLREKATRDAKLIATCIRGEINPSKKLIWWWIGVNPYRERVIIDMLEHPDGVALNFDHFRPRDNWTVSAQGTKVVFCFKTEEDAMAFRLAVF